MARPVPHDFAVDDSFFSYHLKTALQSQTPLTRPLEFRLVDSVYDQMTRYTMYPKSSEYNTVTHALLFKYPYLEYNLGPVQAVKYWKQKITIKARNKRKRQDSTNPLVVERKGRYGSKKC